MRTTLTSSILLLTLTVCSLNSAAFAGNKGRSGSGNFGGNQSSGMQNFSRNFNQGMSGGSGSGSGLNVKKFNPTVRQIQGSVPQLQQFGGSKKPQFNLNGNHNGNHNGNGQHNIVKKQIGIGQIPGFNGGKPIVKIDPGFGQGNHGHGKIGIGINLGGGNHNHHGNHNNHHNNHNNHKHHGCYSWWQGHGYCGGYTHGCKQVVVQPIVQPVAVLAPELAALPTLQVGSKLTMASSAFGPETGVVMLQIDKLMFAVQIDAWQPGAVSFTVPVLMLTGPVKADLISVDQAGNVLVAQAVMLIAAPQGPATAAVTAQ